MIEDKQKIIDKLVKIKALAERGVGGEKVTALQMYEALKRRYGISDEEVQQAEAVPVDISKIDLKQYWGLAFQLATIAASLQEEMDFCNKCPYTRTEDNCGECSTHWNIRDIQLEFGIAQQRLVKAAMEVTG